MSATLKWNLDIFNATLRRAVAESSRAAPDVVNGHALGVALKAVELTEKANKAEIQRQLGQISRMHFTAARVVKARPARAGRVIKSGKNKGKVIAAKEGRGAYTVAAKWRQRADVTENSFAARIINKRLRDLYGPRAMIWGETLKKAVLKVIALRTSSVAFIKSGWLWAVRDLASSVKGFNAARGRNPDKDARINNVRKGRGIPARMGSGLFKATIENTSLIASGGKRQSKGRHNPLAVAERGLILAIKAEQRKMEKHLLEKFQAAMRKAGAL